MEPDQREQPGLIPAPLAELKTDNISLAYNQGLSSPLNRRKYILIEKDGHRRAFRLSMAILISSHALTQALSRGASEREIIEVLDAGLPIRAKYGRKGKAKIFHFGGERLGRFYEDRRVEVFYMQDGGDIIVVTVYVFYGKWE